MIRATASFLQVEVTAAVLHRNKVSEFKLERICRMLRLLSPEALTKPCMRLSRL